MSSFLGRPYGRCYVSFGGVYLHTHSDKLYNMTMQKFAIDLDLDAFLMYIHTSVFIIFTFVWVLLLSPYLTLLINAWNIDRAQVVWLQIFHDDSAYDGGEGSKKKNKKLMSLKILFISSWILEMFQKRGNIHFEVFVFMALISGFFHFKYL